MAKAPAFSTKSNVGYVKIDFNADGSVTLRPIIEDTLVDGDGKKLGVAGSKSLLMEFGADQPQAGVCIQ